MGYIFLVVPFVFVLDRVTKIFSDIATLVDVVSKIYVY